MKINRGALVSSQYITNAKKNSSTKLTCKSAANACKTCHVFIVSFHIILQVTTGFELYLVFGPLVTKPAAIHAINKLLRWIKREEDRLFILNSVSF